MTGLSTSPRLVRGGIVLVDAQSGQVKRAVALQYNPDTLTRTLAAQAVGAESAGHTEPTRLKGPPVETIKLEAELDATDQLEIANSTAVEAGVAAQLAALETLLYPDSEQMQANNALQGAGTLEIAPMEAPLALFVWSASRIVPVRITEFSITEEAFDPLLNPVRAKVSLGLRVLSVDDLGFAHKGGSIYMAYQKKKEALAKKAPSASLQTFGIGALP